MRRKQRRNEREELAKVTPALPLRKYRGKPAQETRPVCRGKSAVLEEPVQAAGPVDNRCVQQNYRGYWAGGFVFARAMLVSRA